MSKQYGAMKRRFEAAEKAPVIDRAVERQGNIRLEIITRGPTDAPAGPPVLQKQGGSENA